MFDEAKHPRNAAGSAIGGKFRLKGEGEKQAQCEDTIRDEAVEYMAGYTSAGKQFFISKGDATSVAIPDKAQKSKHMQGAVLTHNHPAGRSFSTSDVEVGSYFALGEMRAVSKQHDYSIKPDLSISTGSRLPGGWPIRSEILAVHSAVAAEVDAAWNKEKYMSPNPNRDHQVWERAAPILGLAYTRTRRGG